MTDLKARLSDQTELDTRGLALIVAEALRGTDSTMTQVAQEVITWLDLALDPRSLTAWTLNTAVAERLATLPAPMLVRLAGSG